MSRWNINALSMHSLVNSEWLSQMQKCLRSITINIESFHVPILSLCVSHLGVNSLSLCGAFHNTHIKTIYGINSKHMYVLETRWFSCVFVRDIMHWCMAVSFFFCPSWDFTSFPIISIYCSEYPRAINTVYNTTNTFFFFQRIWIGASSSFPKWLCRLDSSPTQVSQRYHGNREKESSCQRSVVLVTMNMGYTHTHVVKDVMIVIAILLPWGQFDQTCVAKR